MIVRLSAKLATKLHVAPARGVPPDDNALVDWSAHLFRAPQTQYVLATNTVTLYSVVFPGRGITDSPRLVAGLLAALRAVLHDDGLGWLYEQMVTRAAEPVVLATAYSPAVTGSMTELVRLARYRLEGWSPSPEATTWELNETPMSVLGDRYPRQAWAELVESGGRGG